MNERGDALYRIHAGREDLVIALDLIKAGLADNPSRGKPANRTQKDFREPVDG